ncbi:PREDICTED: uncharacterized protein LOC108768422 [Trachymyrmex cornetzi]|uniref:uncharacterized protein LOC108768422 n=1 Tax=Trachymyrmex cornetzi TaxID=471704 RepID=UPI00084F6C21|nr:PREDICTED: uncharacterized protein LOC108768422 [Trachymyrmex cornetzi]
MGTSLWLEFIDIVLYTNVSRSHHLQISTEYFIDEQRYFYLLFLHVNATFTIGIVAVLAIGSLFYTYHQYACGMFKVASYRIKRAIHIYTSKDVSTQKEILVYKDLIRAVDIHRKSMTFSTYFISTFQISFMFLLVLGVLSMSLNIFRVRLVFYKSMLMVCILFRYVALDQLS